MNKSSIQKFAVWARTELIAQVSQRAYQYGITEEGYGEADAVVVSGRALTPDEERQRRELVSEIRNKGYHQVMEEVAYTWFNRFIALRFMEVNNYLPSHVRVFSDSTGAFKPEILSDVLHLDLPELDQSKVADLIEKNRTEDLYRYLLLTQCNALNDCLPVMFEKMGGYTELLLPNNILRQDGIIGRLVSDIEEDDWKDQVQIIGWLYQYYNTELNEQVYNGSMSKSRIKKELLSAATTIYTPHWVASYMVENSLGRLWLEGHPDSTCNSEWTYYLDEAEQEPSVEARLEQIRKEYGSINPKDIKIIDPCAGSGHILVYAFDVLVKIYESQGYSRRDAVYNILTKNLYGLEISDRAAQLAYFAIMMKAHSYDRRILSRNIQPNIYAIQESNAVDSHTIAYFANNDPKLKHDIESVISDLYDAKEYGSIINIAPVDFQALYNRFDEIMDDVSLDRQNALNMLPLVKVAEILAQKYDVVITNPPYLSSSRFSPKLDAYVKKNYPDEKADLSMVMLKRAMNGFAKKNGFVAFVTTSSWMFLSSFEKTRNYMFSNTAISSLVDFGTELFDGKVGHNPIVSWIMRNTKMDYKMTAIRLVDYCYSRREEKKTEFFNPRNRYTAQQSNFSKIPGSPVAYWLSKNYIAIFDNPCLGRFASIKVGLQTGDNNRFLRLWYECDYETIFFKCESHEISKKSNLKWYPYNKGGEFRKWYGNNDYVVDWVNDGCHIKKFVDDKGKPRSRPQNTDFYFRKSITYSYITSGVFNARIKEQGFIFDVNGASIFPEDKYFNYILGLLCSCLADNMTKIINPTISLQSGDIAKIPVKIDESANRGISELVDKNIRLARYDWDTFEISWDFMRHPLVPAAQSKREQENSQFCSSRMEKFGRISWHYENWERDCEGRFNQLKKNEEELNRIFIDIYGLQDELSPEVEDKDVTVRLADKGRDVRSLISYAVGCMFGRYSLDEDGLILAGQKFEDKFAYAQTQFAGTGFAGDSSGLYSAQGKCYYKTSDGSYAPCTFDPDRENIIPICDDDYFDDDITGRFVKWVETVYGKETLEENLRFIAEALGGKGTPREVIRNYFLNDFYSDHLKIYQKRPIYWLFDSGKKNGFKALVYMHRYKSDLLARMRTDYVHEQQERYRTQLAHIADSMETATQAEKVRLSKQEKKLREQALEIGKFEEKIHHLADMNIEIDLDDGVKTNYQKFGDVLGKIK